MWRLETPLAVREKRISAGGNVRPVQATVDAKRSQESEDKQKSKSYAKQLESEYRVREKDLNEIGAKRPLDQSPN